MLSENKTGKYLKYALGEITLVVIGILIALQVNSWKEKRNDRALEHRILNGLLSEFNNAQIELEQDSVFRSDIFKSVNFVLRLKHSEQPFAVTYDSISNALDYVKTYRFYSPSHPQLKDLQSSGRFDLLSSKETKEALLRYLEWWDRVSHLEQNSQNSIINNLQPYLSEHCDLSLLETENEAQQNELMSQFKTMLDEPRLGSVMRIRLEELYTLIYYSENLMYFINTCQETITNDLNQFEK